MVARRSATRAVEPTPVVDVLGGGSARSLLVTVLGELVWPDDQPVWTSALLYVLQGLGIEEPTARQAIARAAAAGWITGERRGREVLWTLAPAGRRLFVDGAARVGSVSGTRRAWSGQWLVLLITVPESHRAARKRLYAGLTWAGFGNPGPGVWVSPHPERHDEAAALVAELDLGNNTLSFVGPSGNVGLTDTQIVERAWDLEALRARMQDEITALDALTPEPGDPLLFAHIRVVSGWQRSPFTDPQLPHELLPDWIGHRLSARYREVRAGWAPAVHRRWRELNLADPSA